MEYSKRLSTTVLKQNDSGQIEEREEVNVWKHQTGRERGRRRRRTTSDRPNKHSLVSLLHGNLMTPHRPQVPQVQRSICTIFSLRKVYQEARGK